MLEQLGVDACKFAANYTTANNRQATEYKLPRRECEILVTGYDVRRRAKVIDRWNQEREELATAFANQGVQPATVEPSESMSSYEFWKVLNKFRVEAWEKEIRHNDFLNRVKDECPEISGYETFVVQQTGGNGISKVQTATLNKDQMSCVTFV